VVLKSDGCVDGYFGVACNGSIHVLMYSYYLLASLGVRCPWKKYLTVAQMVQFAACAAQSLYILATPGVCPTALPLTQLWVMSNMLFLFGRFYVSKYVAPAGGAGGGGKRGALGAGALAAAPAGAPRSGRARRAD
jgi:elongation of very long chain fatty acids protein 4